MNENLPSQIKPLSSLSPKVWRYTSFGLIVGGLVLMSWGGWLFAEQQIEAAKPPPAPIVQSLDLLPTDTPTATPTLLPTFTPLPSLTPTETATVMPAVEDSAVAEPTETNTATPSPSPSPTPEPSATSEPTVGPAEVQSLADNPLLVEESPPALETEAQPAQVASTENSPVTLPAAPITRLVAESISLDTPVVAVGWYESVINDRLFNIWQVAEYAAGWHNNSALPGQGGNIVMSGHHNILGEVFRHTVDLAVGDAVTLYMGEQPYQYQVTDKFIVKDKGEPEEVRIANARWIGPFEDERITLVTCWPYNNNTHRVIVIAKPVGAVEAAAEGQN